MRGSRDAWCPWIYRAERHPDVQVVEMELDGREQGCVHVRRRTIWLDLRLTAVEARCRLAFGLGLIEFGPTPEDPRVAAACRRAAEEWAARQLVPPDALVAAFGRSGYLDEIANMLEVDMPTLRARIRGATDEEQDASMRAIRATRLSA